MIAGRGKDFRDQGRRRERALEFSLKKNHHHAYIPLGTFFSAKKHSLLFRLYCTTRKIVDDGKPLPQVHAPKILTLNKFGYYRTVLSNNICSVVCSSYCAQSFTEKRPPCKFKCFFYEYSPRKQLYYQWQHINTRISFRRMTIY